MPTINEQLIDEVRAINAVYGEETLRITRPRHDGLEMRLQLPALSPKDQITFCLNFPFSYPDSSVPTYLYADVGLFESTDRRIQNISLIVFIFLEEVFIPGDVCVFDLIDVVLAAVSCLEGCSVDLEKVEQLGPQLSEHEWRWTNKNFINMNECRQRVDCFICCDDDYSFRMVQVTCKHFYCFSCFQMGWDIALEAREAYTCCRERISIDIIRDYTNATKEQCDDYERLLFERDTVNPFFCGNPGCNILIGSFSRWDLSRGSRKKGVPCPECKWCLCVGCRGVVHKGICVDQKEMLELFKQNDIRRCLKCGAAIEKNGGCSHIQCRNCNSHFQWQKNGTLGKYLGPAYPLNDR